MSEGKLLAISGAISPLDTVEMALAIDLMDHQKVVVDAVRKGFRQLLIADQMGVGKTHSAIGAVEDQEAYPALIVCPSALKYNWEREWNRSAPGVSVSVLSGTSPDETKLNADIVICPDSVLANWTMDKEGTSPTGPISAVDWKSFVIDECHIMKNLSSKRTKAAMAIARKLDTNAVRLMLSGTPMLNRPDELIAPLAMLGLLKPVFGGKAAFERDFVDKQWNGFGYKVVGAKNTQVLNDKLRNHCMIRRTRDEVLTLPNKGRSLITVEMSKEAQTKYKLALTNLTEFFKEKTGDDKYSISHRARAMQLLTALRQVSGMGKVDAVVERTLELLEEGEPVFIATMHTEVVEALLKKLIPYGVVTVTGSDTSEQKQKSVDAFQSGSANILIGNIQAAGVGFTLTRAANIIVAELPWTPGALQQVEDRLHRFGQKRPVTSAVLLSEWPTKSVDDRLWSLMDSKARTINAVLDGVDEGLEVEQEGSFQDLLLNSFREQED